MPQDMPNAKRLRELALKEGPSVSHDFQLPMPSSSPSPPAPPRRRGRKPAGALSKSAREQLRKTNHSVIEKRRREKINEALTALRQLVPPQPESKDKEEREFKLEILVRTVDYLRNMVDRMALLEQGLCRACAQPLITVREPCLLLPDEEDDDDMLDEQPPREQQLPRLPSISSWLTSPPVQQLPSPPQSAPCAPTEVATSSLPNLVLPPAVHIPDAVTIMVAPPPQPPAAAPPPHRHHRLEIQSLCHDVGPAGRRRWSRDEHTAASLLLNIASNREMASVQTLEKKHGVAFQVYTPRSMLGMPSRGSEEGVDG